MRACFEKLADQTVFMEEKSILTNGLMMSISKTFNVLDGISSARDVCVGNQNWW